MVAKSNIRPLSSNIDIKQERRIVMGIFACSITWHENERAWYDFDRCLDNFKSTFKISYAHEDKKNYACKQGKHWCENAFWKCLLISMSLNDVSLSWQEIAYFGIQSVVMKSVLSNTLCRASKLAIAFISDAW